MGRLPKQSKRTDLIKGFKELGFDGPHTGTGKHPEFMACGNLTVKMPNPHRRDIGEGLLKRILGEAGITEAQWIGSKQKCPDCSEITSYVPLGDEMTWVHIDGRPECRNCQPSS